MMKQITHLTLAFRAVRPVLVIGLVSVGLAISAEAASFDCNKAATTVEKLICSTPRLSALDDLMQKDYAAVSAANIGDGARTQLKNSQRAWLKTRNACVDAACIDASYMGRLDQVCGDFPVLSGAFPTCVAGADDVAAALKDKAAQGAQAAQAQGTSGAATPAQTPDSAVAASPARTFSTEDAVKKFGPGFKSLPKATQDAMIRSEADSTSFGGGHIQTREEALKEKAQEDAKANQLPLEIDRRIESLPKLLAGPSDIPTSLGNANIGIGVAGATKEMKLSVRAWVLMARQNPAIEVVRSSTSMGYPCIYFKRRGVQGVNVCFSVEEHDAFVIGTQSAGAPLLRVGSDMERMQILLALKGVATQ